MSTTTTQPLTREQVLAMPAGRELDALIGRIIFGWGEGIVEMARDGKLEPYKNEAGEVVYAGPPLYSTDIAEAVNVAELVCSRKAGCDDHNIELHMSMEGANGAWASFTVVEDDRQYGGTHTVQNWDAWGQGESRTQALAVAICRAALLTTL